MEDFAAGQDGTGWGWLYALPLIAFFVAVRVVIGLIERFSDGAKDFSQPFLGALVMVTAQTGEPGRRRFSNGLGLMHCLRDGLRFAFARAGAAPCVEEEFGYHADPTLRRIKLIEVARDSVIYQLSDGFDMDVGRPQTVALDPFEGRDDLDAWTAYAVERILRDLEVSRIAGSPILVTKRKGASATAVA